MERMNPISRHFSDGSEKMPIQNEGDGDGVPQRGEITLGGELELPLEFCNQLHRLQLNQSRIVARLDLLFAILRRMGIQEGNGTLEEEGESDISRIQWGRSEEEQKLTLFQILKEAEERGLALRTTEMKDLGGKFSTAVSYSYKIFGGWKQALKDYKDYRKMEENCFDLAEKKG